MAITPQQISASVEAGWGIFCSTCAYLYDGTDAGLLACSKASCAGPVRGGDFPSYKGMIPRHLFRDICLKCGHSEIAFRVVVGGKHVFSLCQGHRDEIDIFPEIGTVDAILVPIGGSDA